MISVIIVNYNGGDKVKKSIQSVLDQKRIDYELIVVDNDSTDGSVKYFNQILSNLKLIQLDKNYGFTKGCNLGIGASKGKFVLILNNDAYLSSESTLREAVNILNKTKQNICGLVPKVLFNWEKTIINSTSTDWHKRIMWYDESIGSINPEIFGFEEERKEVFGAMFIAPFFKRDILIKDGLFDESLFTYGEDFDISYRLNIFGYRFIYHPKIKIYHDFRSSSKDDSDPLWTYFYFLRNYLIVVLKNYEFKNLVLKFFGYTRFIRRATYIAIKRKDIKLAVLILRVFASLAKLSPRILKNRLFVQKRRKLKDEDIWTDQFVINFNPFFYDSKVVLNSPNITKKGIDA